VGRRLTEKASASDSLLPFAFGNDFPTIKKKICKAVHKETEDLS
jgi:hypothetical protein